MNLNIYLSGEIHTAWREEIRLEAEKNNLDIEFTTPVTDHEASDAAGDHLGFEEKPFWRDHKSAKINKLRTSHLIENCDLAIIRFGDQFRQWNAAFDAGYCAALGKPYITLHSEDLIHPLKEVDASADSWAKTPKQVVEILRYIMNKSTVIEPELVPVLN